MANKLRVPAERVKIHCAALQEVENARKQLSRSYGNNNILNVIRYAFIVSLKALPDIEWPDDVPVRKRLSNSKIIDIICNGEGSFEDMLLLLAVFVSDRRNIARMVSFISPAELKLWRLCMEEGAVSGEKALRIIKKKMPELVQEPYLCSWFGPSPDVLERMRWFRAYDFIKADFVINKVLRVYLAPVLFPNAVRNLTVDKLPDGLTTFSDEDGTLRALSLYNVITGGNLYIPGKDKYLISEVKELSRALELKEFFDGKDPDKNRQLARARIFAFLLGALKSVDDLSDMSLPDRCRRIASVPGCVSNQLFRLALMPQLHGKFSGSAVDGTFAAFVRQVTGKIAEISDADGWFDVEKLVFLCRTQFCDGSDINSFFGRGDSVLELNVIDKSREKTATYFGKPMYFTYIWEPGVKGVLFMLAAAGVIEIAYDNRSGVSRSPFDCVRYWRMTPLGRYVFGYDRQYNGNVSFEHSRDFVLDDRFMMVILSNPASPLRDLLNNFAEPVSANRYRVTAVSFLSNCTSLEDVDKKINLIRTYVCDELPPNWIEFFERMRRNLDAVKPEESEYCCFTIAPDDEGLQRLLLNDEKLSEIAVCARGFRVFVDKNKVDEFIRLMKSKGYIVDLPQLIVEQQRRYW